MLDRQSVQPSTSLEGLAPRGPISSHWEPSLLSNDPTTLRTAGRRARGSKVGKAAPSAP